MCRGKYIEKEVFIILYKFIICFIAGIGAGLGTGFAGMSAAAVITPMLVAFLGMDPYMAVGIALASDVLAAQFPLTPTAKTRTLTFATVL